MLSCSPGKIWQGEKIAFEIIQGVLYGEFLTFIKLQECIFQAVEAKVMLLEKSNEIQEIGVIEGTMLKPQEAFKVAILMVEDKIMRCLVHTFSQFQAFIDDGFALPPGQYAGKETHDLDILLLLESMGYTDRVVRNKIRLVKFQYLFVQEIF